MSGGRGISALLCAAALLVRCAARPTVVSTARSREAPSDAAVAQAEASVDSRPPPNAAAPSASLAVGPRWSCVIDRDRVRCWGARAAPRTASLWHEAMDAREIAASGEDLCVLDVNRHLRCGDPLAERATLARDNVPRIVLDAQNDGCSDECARTDARAATPSPMNALDHVPMPLVAWMPRAVIAAALRCSTARPARCSVAQPHEALVRTMLSENADATIDARLDELLATGVERLRVSMSMLCVLSERSLRCLQWARDGTLRTLPVLEGVRDFRVAPEHVCAQRDDGSVWCAGDPSFARVDGRSCSTEPSRVRWVERGAQQIASTDRSVCVIVGSERSSEVLCAGSPMRFVGDIELDTQWPGRTVIARAPEIRELAMDSDGVYWRERGELVSRSSWGIEVERRRTIRPGGLLAQGNTTRRGDPGGSRFCFGDVGDWPEGYRDPLGGWLRVRGRVGLGLAYGACVFDPRRRALRCDGPHDPNDVGHRDWSSVVAATTGDRWLCVQQTRGARSTVQCWTGFQIIGREPVLEQRISARWTLRANRRSSLCATDAQRHLWCSREGAPWSLVDGAVVRDGLDSVAVAPEFVCWIDDVGAVECEGAGPYCELSERIESVFHRVL